MNYSLLCQKGNESPSSLESRLVTQCAMIHDIPLVMVSRQDLSQHRDALSKGDVIPVGSVEFMREAMRLAGKQEPENISYPECLVPYLRRSVRKMRAGSVVGTWFIKPTTTKEFTGFVFDTLGNPENLSCYDRMQYNSFLALPPDVPIWVSEPVTFVTEVRYYIQAGRLLGHGRYDDGPDRAPTPDPLTIMEMVNTLKQSGNLPVAFSLDVGVLDSGETALVECNDAWALGYYKGTLEPKDYVNMLATRWKEILETHRFASFESRHGP